MATETELDLETGETTEKPAEPKKRGRPRGKSKPKVEVEIESRLERLLQRFAELREGRGDSELADAVREDSKAIVGSIVALTRPFVQARKVILTALAIVEPLFAFGRIGRILAGRIAARRAERQPDYDADVDGGYVDETAQEPTPA